MCFLHAVQPLQGVLQVGVSFITFVPAITEGAFYFYPITSQVHEIHPSHAFLDVVDGRAPGSRSNSDPDLMIHHSSSLENLAPQCE